MVIKSSSSGLDLTTFKIARQRLCCSGPALAPQLGWGALTMKVFSDASMADALGGAFAFSMFLQVFVVCFEVLALGGLVVLLFTEMKRIEDMT